MGSKSSQEPHAVARSARYSFVKLGWQLRGDKLGAVGIVIVLAVGILAIGAPIFANHDPQELDTRLLLEAPSTEHYFGTDWTGRDLFSRILYGARPSLIIGLSATLLAGLIGGTWGIASSYFGGRFDLIGQRLVDILQTFPALIMAMLVIAAIGPGLYKTTIAVTLPLIPMVTRVTRAGGFSIRATQYIEAAHAIGANSTRIILVHMIPNALAPWLALIAALLGVAITAEASLSFLGLGVGEPRPSWGGMLSLSVARFAESAPWLVIFPGLFLSLTIYGFNLLADVVRDLFDPRMRGIL